MTKRPIVQTYCYPLLEFCVMLWCTTHGMELDAVYKRPTINHVL